MQFYRQAKLWMLDQFPQHRALLESRLLKMGKTLDSFCLKRDGGQYVSKAIPCLKNDLKRMLVYLYSSACCETDYQDAVVLCLLWYQQKRNMTKTYEKIRALTWSLPYETYPVISIPVCLDMHWSFVVMQNPVVGKVRQKTISYLVKGFATKPLQNNSYDCGVFMLYFMREVNKALVKRSGGDIFLPQRLGEIFAIPTHERGRFNPDLVRMSFVKLLRNDEILQQDV
ncbi:hypothetical protein PHMEG_0005742 [Phytophthora megakarya]|uniref:Ubiquitin-like protease family profile domain-containing protein n=1 Tax=Phytophthora megakarya TaxID=4795 RepID=A0A225WS60_9STRA|nr:hypothetical protein PHMEG_0005742 [Phytophthora megakarya]